MKMSWKKIIGLAIGLLVIVGFIYHSNQKNIVEVEVYEVKAQNLQDKIDELARADVEGKISVVSQGGGIVKEDFVEVGDQVTKGQLLATLDDELIAVQREALQAQVDQAKAQYQARVEEQQVEAKAVGSAQVEQAKIAWEEASRSLEQMKELAAGEAITEEQLKAIEGEVKLAKAAYDLAKAQARVLEKGVNSGERKALLAQIGVAEAALKASDLQLERMKLTSPIQGVILEKTANVGAVIPPGSPFAVIGNLEKVNLWADFLAEEVVKIKVGQKVEVSGELFEKGKVFSAEIERVNPQAITKVSSLGLEQERVPVKIRLTEEIPLLRPNFQVEVNVIVAEKKGVLAVPNNALFRITGEDYVFVNKEGVAQLQKVELGIKGKELTEVTKGISSGDLVILNPSNDLEEGTRIKY